MSARVLIVEDNPDNLALMTYLLQAYGHTVLTASDGRHGLEVARRERPDLIICDVQMPGMDGDEVARWFKSDPELRSTPLVAVTALAMVGDRDRLLAAGFDNYLSTPIDSETFVPQVEVFLRTARPAPSQGGAGPGGTSRDGANDPGRQ
jgi:two-component system cell cycle response regulator